MKILFFFFAVFCFAQPMQASTSFTFNEEQVQSYHDKPDHIDEDVKTLIESGFFKNSKDILDVGCGDGKLTAAFAAQLPNTYIVGCDASRIMIEFALKHYSSSNLNFVMMDAENLEFEKQFDTVISFNCFHWLNNQKRALDQIYSILKPGGKVCIVATPESLNNDFKTICRSIILSFRWAPYFITFRPVHSFHTEKEYTKMLTKTGFLIDKVEIKQEELIFKNKEELELFLKAVLTPLQHLDPRNQPAFLKDFFKELKRRGRVDSNGTIHIFFDQIELVFSKSLYNNA